MSTVRRRRPVRTLVWHTLSFLAKWLPGSPRMTVLLYHSISPAGDFFAVSPEEFSRQIRYLAQTFDVVPLARAFAHAAGEEVSRDSVAITFDDGYCDFLTTALPILKQNGVSATVFILGDSPDRAELGNSLPLLSAEDTRSLASEPLIAVGSHALSHRKLTRLAPTDLLHELMESRRYVTERTGSPPAYLAYPKGNHNKSVMEAAAAAGYEGAVSVVERGVRPEDHPYGLPRIQIDGTTSFPLFVAKLSRASDWYYGLWSFFRRTKRK